MLIFVYVLEIMATEIVVIIDSLKDVATDALGTRHVSEFYVLVLYLWCSSKAVRMLQLS
jgi:hypothetical protein